MTSVKLKCWRYSVPENCYRAIEWCGGECAQGELKVISEGKVIHFREAKSGAASEYPITVNTVYKVEDSSRYFVLVAAVGQPIGVGFKSREESKTFLDAIGSVLSTPLSYYTRCDKEKIQRAIHYQQSQSQSQGQSIQGNDNSSGEAHKSTCNNAHTQTKGFDNPPSQPSGRYEFREGAVKDKEVVIDAGNEGMVRTTRASYAPLPVSPLRIKTDTEISQTDEETQQTTITTTTATTVAQTTPEDKKEKEKEEEEKEEKKSDSNERRHQDEDFTQKRWRKHNKHMFMLSIAGKPIYSRYGDEQQLSPFTATLSALLSFVVNAGDDTLRYFVAGERQFVFFVRGPVALVCVCGTGEPRADLRRQMFCVYQQVALLLSSRTIAQFLRQRPGCDLRSLMSQSDFALLDYVVHSCNTQPGTIFDAYQPLPLPRELRAEINDTVVAAASCKEVLFTALFAGHELIHLACPPRLVLDPVDLHALMHFVGSSTALRSSRTWTPLCLPMFDDAGFVGAYIRCVTDDITLVIISSKKDVFYPINERADVIVDKLERSGAIARLATPPRICTERLGTSSLVHFAFVAAGYRQVIVPPFTATGYRDSPAAQKRIYRRYKALRAGLETPSPNLLALAGSDLGPHRFVYKTSKTESFAVWTSRTFEFYVTFSSVKSKSQAVTACNNIVSYILKNEETLFITNIPTLK